MPPHRISPLPTIPNFRRRPRPLPPDPALPQTPRSAAEDDDLSLFSGEPDLAAAILVASEARRGRTTSTSAPLAAALAQAVSDHGVAATPVAYFAAASVALAPLARAGPGAGDRYVAGVLLAFLSAAVPALPLAVVRARGREVADDVARVLEFPSTPDSGVRAGIRCLAHLISAGDKASWRQWSRSTPWCYGSLPITGQSEYAIDIY